MKTITTANTVPSISSIWVHGSYITQAMVLLSNITKDSFENTAIQKFDIGVEETCPALLYKTGSYERELEEFKKTYGHQLPLIDLEFVEINKGAYIAVTLKKEKETIKELNDSGFNVWSFLHIGYATNNGYAHTINNNKDNLANRLPGVYQPLNHPSFLEGKDFWLINNYSVGPEVLQRFIDTIKDQVPFNLEVVKINSYYYIAMTEKKEEPKKEPIFIGNMVNPKARLTLEELNSTDFYSRRLGIFTLGHPWTSINFGSASVEDRQEFVNYHNNLNGKIEFQLYQAIVYYRTRPKEVKEEPKAEPVTETKVIPETTEQFLVIDEDNNKYAVADYADSIGEVIEVAKEHLGDDEGEVQVYQLIGTVKRTVKYESTAQEVKTNPLAAVSEAHESSSEGVQAANHPAEQPKTNGIDYADPTEQYAGGF